MPGYAPAEARFIRDDEEPGEVSWEERLARAYESKLFKEFALVRSPCCSSRLTLGDYEQERAHPRSTSSTSSPAAWLCAGAPPRKSSMG